MRAVDIITKKRDGKKLTKDELGMLINGYVLGDIPEYQISAWLMAVFLKGLSFEETADLTNIMLDSGSKMDLAGIKGPFIDKHSTGGVGDKISLILAPIVAACGIKVPMMSGRALGHTGGTLDKLESIPGYNTKLDNNMFRNYIENDGFAMTGQTDSIVPADKKLYSLRDVTGTVESIPLITASILSKKVAEGAEALVFDVKCGSGAFMKNISDAELLANSLVKTGAAMGKNIVSVITAMDEPLGNKVGNFFEIEESIDCLKNNWPTDIKEITIRLCAWMLILGGKASNIEEASKLCMEAVSSGRALELFMSNVTRQGGDAKAIMSMYGQHRSQFMRELKALDTGYIQSIDAFKIGLAGVYLGVGRNKTSDPVSSDVGFIFNHKKSSHVNAGDTIAYVYGRDTPALDNAWPIIMDSITISKNSNNLSPYIIKEISSI